MIKVAYLTIEGLQKLKDELEKYEQTLQNKLAQKETELDEKIKLYEAKIKLTAGGGWAAKISKQ